MRIVIDLQACQSTGSRNRGIGRYSLALAKAMLRSSSGHEFHLLLSDAFPDTIEPLRQTFDRLLPPENIHVWELPQPVAELFPENAWRAKAAQFVREQMIANLRPDFVHIASLFEGSGDDVVSSIGLSGHQVPTAVTLYDLIPLVYERQYLLDERQRAWYYRRLHVLKKADLLLAISESSRQEGLSYLDVDHEKVVNISSAVDENFGLFEVSLEQSVSICQRYRLNLPYVMYTGGVDLRKNIDGLIRAFAMLPVNVRTQHQLAIVCSVHSEEKLRLQKLVKSLGLRDSDVVLTGFVPDADLPILYRGCKLFVFPSWHEGFGLPALEAMSCGVPVIASNTSSLPEVLGNDAALFDPHSTEAISSKIEQVLMHPEFAAELVERGLLQAQIFSWDASATKAIRSFESARNRCFANRVRKEQILPRRKLAYVSPLPPLQSGIADYSAELIPSLEEFYDITLIVEQECVSDPWIKSNFRIRDVNWYKVHFSEFDRVIFHLGNSPVHAFMYALFDYRPGVVVLHDFFLSDSLAYLDMNAVKPGIWTKALYESHGYPALIAQREPNAHADLIKLLPCSLGVLKRAEGIIVHSTYSVELIRTWLGDEIANRARKIPHLRKLPVVNDKLAARRALDLAEDEILICSFGLLGHSKRNHCLLEACIKGRLFLQYKIRLVFVGQNDPGDFGSELLRKIKASNFDDRIKITGFAEKDLYRKYLQAADIAVQLRTSSRGESSGTIFDCLGYGVPLIANKNGSISELPPSAAQLLDDDFTLDQLIDSVDQLCSNRLLREEQSLAAKAYMSVDRKPCDVARKYFESLEIIDSTEPNAILQHTLKGLVEIELPANDDDWHMVAKTMAVNRASIDEPVVFLDVTSLVDGTYRTRDQSELIRCLEKTLKLIDKRRVEFVTHSVGGLHYARSWSREFFGLLASIGEDDHVDVHDGDIYFSLFSEFDSTSFLSKAKWSRRIADIDRFEQKWLPPEITNVVGILQELRKEVAEILSFANN